MLYFGITFYHSLIKSRFLAGNIPIYIGLVSKSVFSKYTKARMLFYE
jgi:hypothetical protein